MKRMMTQTTWKVGGRNGVVVGKESSRTQPARKMAHWVCPRPYIAQTLELLMALEART